MIFFHAEGRLGNQIFQYCFLRACRKPGEWIVTSNLGELLATFTIDDARILNFQSRSIRFIARNWLPKIMLALSRIFLVSHIRQERDNQGRFLPQITRRRGLFPITFVESHFFQSEMLANIDDFRMSATLNDSFVAEAVRELNGVPASHQPVFVHIRRGDYVRETYRDQRDICLPLEFYRSAMELVARTIEKPWFVFVSDDPKYVETAFADIRQKQISHLSQGGDLALMTLCSAGIISNSSFSWWGSALMCERAIIVAPKYWYGWRLREESHPGIQPSYATVIDVR